MTNPRYITIAANKIIIPENRQRRDLGDIEELAMSIKENSQFSPILITEYNILIAGERRLRACMLIRPSYKINARIVETTDPDTLQLIEFEENIKRKQFTWQEEAKAIATLHKRFSKNNEKWTMEETAKKIGLSQQHVSKNLKLAQALDNPRIANSKKFSEAYNIVTRETKRAVLDELNQISAVMDQPLFDIEDSSSYQVLQQDFNKWAETYNGTKFNLLHCDFPYGIGHDKSGQGGTASGRWEGYKDSKDVYWALCESLANNIDKILPPSAHVMFWLSMNNYQSTIDFFHKNTDLKLVSPHPLIWYKSNNLGIAPNPHFAPRNVYETALMFSRGNRETIKTIPNCFSMPSYKQDAVHVSEKPLAVLKHFFQMFVDDKCELLDPTCGSGTSLRAAKDLGAARTLGIELNPDFAKVAEKTLFEPDILEGLKSKILATE